MKYEYLVLKRNGNKEVYDKSFLTIRRMQEKILKKMMSCLNVSSIVFISICLDGL